MHNLLHTHLAGIRDLCQAHHVLSLHAFGSVLRQEFGPHSDIDLVVVFDRSRGHSAFAQYFDFKEALETLLGREVDLVSGHAVRNPFFQKQVEATKVLLYAA